MFRDAIDVLRINLPHVIFGGPVWAFVLWMRADTGVILSLILGWAFATVYLFAIGLIVVAVSPQVKVTRGAREAFREMQKSARR